MAVVLPPKYKKVTIAGKTNDGHFQMARVAAKSWEAEPGNNFEAQIVGLCTTDWDVYLKDKKKVRDGAGMTVHPRL